MPDTNNHLRPIGRRGPRLLGLTFVIIAGWVGAALFLHWRDLPPHVTIPEPKLPAHNAYDDFERAYKLERDSGEIVWGLLPTHEHLTPADRAYTPVELAEAVRDNAAALRAIHEGLQHQYLQPPERLSSAPPYDSAMDALSQDRELGRLMHFVSYVDGERGDWSGAATVALDCMQMGAETTHGGDIVALLNGGAVQSTGRADLQKAATHLSARATVNAAHRLEAIVSEPESLSQAVREDEWTGAALYRSGMLSPHWREFDRSEDKTLKGSVLRWLRFQIWSNERIMDDYTRYMDSIAAIYRRPYPLRKRLPPVPVDPISDIYAFPSLLSLRVAQISTNDNLLIVYLALHAYDLDHHRFPDQLSQLMPQYLPSLSTDPFTVNAPLRYHRSGAGYILYSVGPDGKDDSGRPIPTKNADGTHAPIDANSKGDIAITGQEISG